MRVSETDNVSNIKKVKEKVEEEIALVEKNVWLINVSIRLLLLSSLHLSTWQLESVHPFQSPIETGNVNVIVKRGVIIARGESTFERYTSFEIDLVTFLPLRLPPTASDLLIETKLISRNV